MYFLGVGGPAIPLILAMSLPSLWCHLFGATLVVQKTSTTECLVWQEFSFNSQLVMKVGTIRLLGVGDRYGRARIMYYYLTKEGRT